MKNENMVYEIKDYNKQSTFSSFLPGISGLRGIPIWCYYVNRGQGVVSFGVQDKDHAIMEFYPAHQAYKNVKRTGFRTFIKKDGTVFEPFANEKIEHKMKISMNQLEVVEMNDIHNIETSAVYFTLPTEKVGALVRKLTIKNTSDSSISIEFIDGMPMCIPYGVNQGSIKTMGQTVKAWMQVEDLDKKVPYYKVRTSMEDTAAVTEVKEGNFSFACLEDGTKLSPIVDPEAVFDYDTALENPVAFEENSIDEILSKKQVTQNQLPSSFYGTAVTLGANESITIYEVVGQVNKKDNLDKFLSQKIDGEYFKSKQLEAKELADNLCKVIDTKTGCEVFDAYTKYTYMDNVLRGGSPVVVGKDKCFYVYSRKHGDIERDYNYFSLLPEYYSQGNGNFRDVNQNRRCDNFFSTYLGTENIKMFYDFIQLDGYNPLSIEKMAYTLDKEQVNEIVSKNNLSVDRMKNVLSNPFTPGYVLMQLEEDGIDLDKGEKIVGEVMDASKQLVNASFGEGYWSDHWTYNLDLIDSYLEIYPEKEEELLFSKVYNYFLAHVTVNKRAKRYVKTDNGIRQYHAVDEENRQHDPQKLVKNKAGEVVSTTLIEKLILLSSVKYATLDSYGMGVEMEGGKPGWYDALNGLPGVFGSSMAEVYELSRNLEYTINSLKNYPKDVELFEELNEFIELLEKATLENKESIQNDQEIINFWNAINDAKEVYRAKVFAGINGNFVTVASEKLVGILELFQSTVKRGIKKACDLTGGMCPTYFTFDVKEFEETSEGIIVKKFEVSKIPYFLEGAVRYLKLNDTEISKQEIYNKVKNSDLYDTKLKMYKVNAPLKDTSFEIGRAKAFTPGWLENESIWLHMEYKYLLEILKSGMYEDFFVDFKNAVVPFLDPKVYGRSILENSSFIASSANPNENYHGKGFVARLSGSTIEFLHMWKIMMFGQEIFRVENEELCLELTPIIPEYLLDDSKQIEATFLGKVKVVYNFDKCQNYTPENYNVVGYKLQYNTGESCDVDGSVLCGKIAEDIRNGDIKNIEVTIKSCN